MITYVVNRAFLQAGEIRRPGDNILLSQRDARSLLLNGRISPVVEPEPEEPPASDAGIIGQRASFIRRPPRVR